MNYTVSQIQAGRQLWEEAIKDTQICGWTWDMLNETGQTKWINKAMTDNKSYTIYFDPASPQYCAVLFKMQPFITVYSDKVANNARQKAQTLTNILNNLDVDIVNETNCGEKIAEALGAKKKDGRYVTARGLKSNYGLVDMIREILIQA